MPAYGIVDIEVTNAEAMGPYMASVADTVAAHGGKYLVRGGAAECIEGEMGNPVKVVLEFPTMDALKGWYHSAEYKEILPNRLENASGNFIFVEGV
ncbi:MAG: DUF1330 domain-containing protein [Pseudomonadota bacterium]